MLRAIKNSQLGLRLIALKVSIDTNTATSSVDVGASDVSSITYNGTGDLTVTLKKAFRRTPIAVACSTTAGSRAHVVVGSGTTLEKVQVNHTGADGSASDGDAYVLIAGFDSNYTDNLRQRQFQAVASQTRTRLMGFYVDGTGTAAINYGVPDATLTDNGTGDYTLTFTKAYARAPIAIATVVGSAVSAAVTASSVSAIDVETTNAAGAAADADFMVLVFGFDSHSETGGQFRPIMSTQRQARLLPLQLINTLGTPSASIGSELIDSGTVTDNGTGNYSVTWADAFVRSDDYSVVAITANAGSGSYGYVGGNTKTGLQVIIVDNAGSAADEGCDVLVLGYDSPNET